MNWCLDNDILVANTGTQKHCKPGSAEMSSPDVTLFRNCEVRDWLPTLGVDSGHFRITYSVVAGSSLERVAPAIPRTYRLYIFKIIYIFYIGRVRVRVFT